MADPRSWSGHDFSLETWLQWAKYAVAEERRGLWFWEVNRG